VKPDRSQTESLCCNAVVVAALGENSPSVPRINGLNGCSPKLEVDVMKDGYDQDLSSLHRLMVLHASRSLS
jgi:hypothetical protein